MILPYETLTHALRTVGQNLFPDSALDAWQIRPCADRRFGDYQWNGAMGLAKLRKANPRALAELVLQKLDLQGVAKAEIAGAGFINFKIEAHALGSVIQSAAQGQHLFTARTPQPRTVVVDFSGPNVAKPMHVGHIRSTILGDSISRVLRFLGHQVVTDNHIGDWGTQFGKLTVGWKTRLNRERLAVDPIGEMERLYREINTECESDPALLSQAREELVKLQRGDTENLQIWREMIALSQSQFDTIYGRLGVRFDHVLGESSYNEALPKVVEDLKEKGLARTSEGAEVLFFDDHATLKNHPVIVRKSDGAANYTTTDLATLQYRVDRWHPQEIVYVTDARQQLHFQQVFEAFSRWQPQAGAGLSHVWFGSILGEDGKPFKTRSGETVKLADLLDEAEERAYAVVHEKNPDLSEKEKREIGRIVGIGSVKYADLSQNRQSDYVFSWSKMLALVGNTAPYLQYATTRIRSIFRKAGTVPIGDNPVTLTEEAELQLARHLIQFGWVLQMVASEYRPNYLCSYLYELAGYFATFYEKCPVLTSEGAQRGSRLALCDATGKVLLQGLELLGIEAPESM